MMANPSQLFCMPEELQARQDGTLSVDDLNYLSEAFAHCRSLDWSTFGRNYLKLQPADIENIDADSNKRRLKIQRMIERWHEIAASATPKAISDTFDKAFLCGIKQRWWSKYHNEVNQRLRREFMESRDALMLKFSNLNLSDENFAALLRRLDMCDKSNDIGNKLSNLFDWWTEKHGYIAASEDRLVLALRDCGLAEEANVIAGGEPGGAPVAAEREGGGIQGRPHSSVHGGGAPREVAGDSVPVDGGASQNRSGVVPFNTDGLENVKFHFGILHVEEDTTIAERIASTIERLSHTACRFENFIPPCGAGCPKTQKRVMFCDASVCVLWIANCDSKQYDEFGVEFAHHNAIQTERKNFIVLIPRERLDTNWKSWLPKPSRAYDPLLEDDNFEECLEATFKRIVKKLQSMQNNR